jgi:iron complex transport system substrate-binding protein
MWWYVGKVLCPEAFRDIEIPRKADELDTFFYGHPLYGEMEGIFGGFKPLAEIRWKR